MSKKSNYLEDNESLGLKRLLSLLFWSYRLSFELLPWLTGLDILQRIISAFLPLVYSFLTANIVTHIIAYQNGQVEFTLVVKDLSFIIRGH